MSSAELRWVLTITISPGGKPLTPPPTLPMAHRHMWLGTKGLKSEMSDILQWQIGKELLIGETSVLGQDRDREIRLIKTYYETEAKKNLMLRRDRDETVSFFYVRDETETSLDSEFQARPRRDRESCCLFL